MSNGFNGKKAPTFTAKTAKVSPAVKKAIAKRKLALVRQGASKPDKEARKVVK